MRSTDSPKVAVREWPGKRPAPVRRHKKDRPADEPRAGQERRTEGYFMEPSRNRLVTSPGFSAFLSRGVTSDPEVGPIVPCCRPKNGPSSTPFPC